MTIELVEIEQPDCFEALELQRRAQDMRSSDRTTCYQALSDGREVAFVALDRWPELDRMVLYEMFVPRRLRRQGYGGAVLNAVEHAALKESFSAVRVTPQPLDDDMSREALIEWYCQRGYKHDPSVPGEMEKHITKVSH